MFVIIFYKDDSNLLLINFIYVKVYKLKVKNYSKIWWLKEIWFKIEILGNGIIYIFFKINNV